MAKFIQNFLLFLHAHFRLKELFFFTIGTYILYHEVVISQTAEPLLIFTALFLYGLIPAFWQDTRGIVPPSQLKPQENKVKKED